MHQEALLLLQDILIQERDPDAIHCAPHAFPPVRLYDVAIMMEACCVNES